MSPCELLQNHGICLDVTGDELRLSPREKITPEIVRFARAHKLEIISELQSSIIYTNPYPENTAEARRESMFQVMDAIFRDAFHTVRATYEENRRQFNPTPSLLAIEKRIAALQQAVLRGHAHLEDFRDAVDEWAQKSMLN